MNSLLAHCSAIFSEHGNLFLVFFLGGLTGGFTHCLGMCGSLLASATASCPRTCAIGCNKSSGTLQKAIGIRFHLGRVITYGVLGFAASAFSMQIAALSFWPVLSSSLLVMAGLLFLVSSIPHCSHRLPQLRGSAFAQGALLGFMPCGLLYAALMMAATITNPIAGMVAMWLFTLGTVPSLLLASAGTQLLSIKWQNLVQKLGLALMAFNGISLLIMAARTIR